MTMSLTSPSRLRLQDKVGRKIMEFKSHISLKSYLVLSDQQIILHPYELTGPRRFYTYSVSMPVLAYITIRPLESTNAPRQVFCDQTQWQTSS